jgi:hypothetical protein
MEGSLREELEKSEDPLAKALIMARVGNYIDFGAMNRVDQDEFLTLFRDTEMREDDRQTYDRDDIEFTCEIKQCDDGALGTIQQELLLEEILARVSRDTEFREDDHLHPTTFGLGDDTLYLLDVVIHISHLHGGNGSGHFYKSVFHNFTFWMSFSMSV